LSNLAEMFTRSFEHLSGRLGGPLSLRLIMQPLAAILCAILAGWKDARKGHSPYLWALFTHKGHRRDLISQAFRDVGKVFVLAILLDAIYQVVLFRFVYPGESLLVAFSLAFVPYVLIRGPVTRMLGCCVKIAAPGTTDQRDLPGKIGVVLVRIQLGLLVALMSGWSALAIYFSILPGEKLRLVLAFGFATAVAGSFAFLPNRRRTLVVFLTAFALLVAGWLCIPASHERDWTTDAAVLPRAEIAGNSVTIRNVRNFDHHTMDDFTVRYDDRTYDLHKLRTLDVVLSYWEGNEDIAHGMLSFGFEGDDYLVVSAETRRETDEPQTGLRGLFKQYEMIYVLAEERDILRLRTNLRGEDVYLYRTLSTPEEASIVFLDVLKSVEKLAEKPRFYNTIIDNCTTGLIPHLLLIRPRRNLFDLRICLNGRSDEMMYDNGFIDREGLTFPELRRRHHINAAALAAGAAPDFSARIRTGLAR